MAGKGWQHVFAQDEHGMQTFGVEVAGVRVEAGVYRGEWLCFSFRWNGVVCCCYCCAGLIVVWCRDGAAGAEGRVSGQSVQDS